MLALPRDSTAYFRRRNRQAPCVSIDKIRVRSKPSTIGSTGLIGSMALDLTMGSGLLREKRACTPTCWGPSEMSG